MSRTYYEGLVLTRPLPSVECEALKPLRRVRKRWAKLDDQDVLTIRQMFNAGVGVTALSRQFGIQRSTVYHIVNYDTHTTILPDEIEEAA